MLSALTYVLTLMIAILHDTPIVSLQWYDDSKIGIFIHFGVFSVPSFVSEWFWCYWKCPDRTRQDVQDFMDQNYPKGFTYQDFAKDLT